VEINLAQARAILELTLDEYSQIRADYWQRVYDAVHDYMSGNDAITTHKAAMKRAVIEAFGSTADTAYQDGGGTLPMDEDTLAWYVSRQNAELGYVDALFQTLKMERTEAQKDGDIDALSVGVQHADAYAKTLDSIYANVKCMAAGNEMLTFVGEDGDESCSDCRKYKNKTHRAKWWVAKDAVPPSRNFECHGYRCQHVLTTKDGRLFTI
jgi:hypothetical protein